jgi:hypothetical protein
VGGKNTKQKAKGKRQKWAAGWAALLVAATLCGQGQNPTSVILSAPKVHLVSGEEVQLLALARERSGLPVLSSNFTWSSSDPEIIAVSSTGLATARKLGRVNVEVRLGGLRHSIQMQSLPKRLEISPRNPEIFVGDQVQFTATALDINDNAIPNPPVEWQIAFQGPDNASASISSSGMLQARVAGRTILQALIRYNTGPPLVGEFIATLEIDIKARTAYRLTRLLSSDDVRSSVHLRPVHTPFAFNENGQIAFVNPLDGVSSALLLYDGGRFDVLATAGMPGPFSSFRGTGLGNFSNPAMNNRGEVLTLVNVEFGGSALAIATREGLNYALFDGQPGAGFARLCCYNIGFRSMNDNGEIVFNAGWQADNQQSGNGLFRLSAGALRAVATTRDGLPGLTGIFHFREFGIDKNGVVYFIAASNDDNSKQALYRADPLGTPVKIVATGEDFAGVRVHSLGNLVVSSGTAMAFFAGVDRAPGRGVRYLAAGGAPQILNLDQVGRFYDINDSGAVLMDANAGGGWGLHRWLGNAVTPLALWGRLFGDSPLWQTHDAHINARGEVVVAAATWDNDLVVARLGSSATAVPTKLFAGYQRLDVTVNLMLQGLVTGASTGPGMLLLGNPPSVFSWDGSGWVPRILAGDRLPGIGWYTGAALGRHPDGDLYFGGFGNYPLARTTASGFEPLLPANTQLADGPYLNGVDWWGLQVNSKGQVAFRGWTSEGSRFMLADGGRVRSLPMTAAASPLGRAFDVRRWELNDLGEVVTPVDPDDGLNLRALFLFANDRWQLLARQTQTAILGKTLSGLSDEVVAGANSFYFSMSLSNQQYLLKYEGGVWTILASEGDTAPNGGRIRNFGNISANRRGDLAFQADIQGVGAIILRLADGTMRLVAVDTEVIADAAPPLSFNQLDLRDDRTLYFTASDSLGRAFVFLAEPR